MSRISGSCTNRHNVGGWGIPCPVVGIVSHTLRLDQPQPTLARREGNVFPGKMSLPACCGESGTAEAASFACRPYRCQRTVRFPDARVSPIMHENWVGAQYPVAEAASVSRRMQATAREGEERKRLRKNRTDEGKAASLPGRASAEVDGMPRELNYRVRFFVPAATIFPKLHNVAHAWLLRRVFCPHLADAVGPIIQGIVDHACDGMIRRVCNRHQFPVRCGIDSYRMLFLHEFLSLHAITLPQFFRGSNGPFGVGACLIPRSIAEWSLKTRRKEMSVAGVSSGRTTTRRPEHGCWREATTMAVQFCTILLTSFPEGKAMANFKGLASLVSQLRAERVKLVDQLRHVDATLSVLGKLNGGRFATKPRRSISARRKMSAAQKARWAKRGNVQAGTASPRPILSAAARRKIAAAQRERWKLWRANHKKAA